MLFKLNLAIVSLVLYVILAARFGLIAAFALVAAGAASGCLDPEFVAAGDRNSQDPEVHFGADRSVPDSRLSLDRPMRMTLVLLERSVEVRLLAT